MFIVRVLQLIQAGLKRPKVSLVTGVSSVRFHRTLKLGALLLWLATFALLQFWIWKIECTPGDPGGPPMHWPELSDLARFRDRYHLLLFVRLDCPCSLATIRELDRLMCSLPEQKKPLVQVVVLGRSHGNVATVDCLKKLEALVVSDPNGEEAARFGVKTSGQLLLYDPQSRLCFRGGLTIARGHEGEARSSVVLRAILSDRIPSDGLPTSAAVFGCPLDLCVDKSASLATSGSLPFPSIKNLGREDHQWTR